MGKTEWHLKKDKNTQKNFNLKKKESWKTPKKLKMRPKKDNKERNCSECCKCS
jgi:hypothetical protein